MKKLLNLGLILSLFCYSTQSKANLWSFWEQEDEEINTYGYPKELPAKPAIKDITPAATKFNVNPSQVELPKNAVMIENQTYQTDINPSATNIVINRPAIKQKYFQSIDYDTLNYERELSDQDIYNSVSKWTPDMVNVYWENYRGNNVRVEVLKSNRDVKEMRLKFIQSQHLNSNADGSISDMLENVANKVMKSICGRKARQSIILYERPSVELVRETPASGYKIITKGSSIKEYGFRCIY